jgi:hypothetical protein
LLAELRAISKSSSSRDRFQTDNDNTIDNCGTSALPIKEEKIDVVNANVPPWKRGKSSTNTISDTNHCNEKHDQIIEKPKIKIIILSTNLLFKLKPLLKAKYHRLKSS